MVRHQMGQGLIEVVFSIGVIVVVLTAVVSLVVASLHSRTSGYDRKKAAELGQKVIEQLIAGKQQQPEEFWNLGSSYWSGNLNVGKTLAGYDGYTYTIGFVQTIDPAIGCPANPMMCANATVGVGYSDNDNNNVVFTRFFNR